MALTYSELKAEVKRRAIRDQGGTEYDTTIGILINSSLFRLGREALWRVLRRKDALNTVTSYTTGTGAASFTNGSASFSVTGATFLTDGVKPRRRISCSTDSRVYEIATITSETEGTLTRVYDGTTTTTGSYEIYPQEEYILPPQCSHRMWLYHDQLGYPFKMEYATEQEFRDSGVDDTQKGDPLLYRMWGEDMARNQPASASVITISSSSASDTGKNVTVFGTVSGYPDYEIITTNASNGTTEVSGSKQFTNIERVVKDASIVGRITASTNSGAVTVAVLPVGATTSGILYRKIKVWPLPDDVFPINVLYYKDVYRLVNDGDVHELGQEFDEALILLCVAKIKYQDNQKEGDRFIQLYADEVKSLKRHNADKIDHFMALKKPYQSQTNNFLHPHVSFQQLGGHFGSIWRR